MFNVFVKSGAVKRLKKVPGDVREKILSAIKILEKDPVPVSLFDVKKIKGYDDFFRIRIGKYRLIYQVRFEDRTVIVWLISTREKAYKGI